MENKLKSWGSIYKKNNGNPHDVQLQENVLVLKSLNKQDSQDTKKDIKEQHVKIADIKVAILNIKEVNNGGILLECLHNDDFQKLKAVTEAKLGKENEIREPKFQKPRINIVGLDEELNEDRLKYAIINQNKCSYKTYCI